MYSRFAYIALLFFCFGLLRAEDELPILECESYYEFVNDSIRYPIDYQLINDCPGLLFHETGIASFYARKFHGRLTANGELFHRGKMTVAHKTLPFGSIVQIRKVGSDTTILARVNDRGPFISGRIVDLSTKAAGKLNIEGIDEVDLLTITPDKDFLPVNVDYFFAFSYLHNPMCIDFENFTVLESTTDFEKALSTLDSYVAENGNRDYYLCIPAGRYDRKQTRDDLYTYYICKIIREPSPLILSE